MYCESCVVSCVIVCFDFLLTSVQLNIKLAANKFIFFYFYFSKNTREVKCSKIQGLLGLDLSAGNHDRCLPSRSDRRTNFKTAARHSSPPNRGILQRLNVAKKAVLLKMSRSHALGHANAITWTFAPSCCWLRNLLLCIFPCPLLLRPSLHPTIPPYRPVLSPAVLLLLLPLCHAPPPHTSVAAAVPPSLSPSARPVSSGHHLLKNDRKLSRLSAAFFFSSVCFNAFCIGSASASRFVLPRDTLVLTLRQQRRRRRRPSEVCMCLFEMQRDGKLSSLK